MEIFPVFENYKEPTFPDYVEWKWLDDCINDMEETAQQLGITPLSRFVTYSRQDALGAMSKAEVKEMEDEAELKDGCFYLSDGLLLWSVEPEWFDTQEGLRTTRGLLEYLQSHPEQFGGNTSGYTNAMGFTMILGALENALVQASDSGQRFHLTPLC